MEGQPGTIAYVILLEFLCRLATTCRSPVYWEDTVASAPREWELSG